MQLVARLIDILYRVLCLFPQQDKIALLSRQSASPFDFELLEPALAKAFPTYRIVWCCVSEGGKLTPGTMVAQLWHVATARLCFVDGYVPAVSIPRGKHRAYRIQLWHALGAVKKFGYQSVGTAAGRSARSAEAFSMHKGYDLIVAGLSGAVPAFAEAFGYAPDRIKALGLPRCDYLLREEYAAQREERAHELLERVGIEAERADTATAAADVVDGGKPLSAPAPKAKRKSKRVVLYAPTFRKNNADPSWLSSAVAGLDATLPPQVELVVSAHPLDAKQLDGGALSARVHRLSGMATIDALQVADYVVSDYSAVAFEAMLAGKKTLFFVPDIEEYRRSPGLNVDPMRDLPSISATDARGIASIIAADMQDGTYDVCALQAFKDAYGITACAGHHAIQEIVDAAKKALG